MHCFFVFFVFILLIYRALSYSTALCGVYVCWRYVIPPDGCDVYLCKSIQWDMSQQTLPLLGALYMNEHLPTLLLCTPPLRGTHGLATACVIWCHYTGVRHSWLYIYHSLQWLAFLVEIHRYPYTLSPLNTWVPNILSAPYTLMRWPFVDSGAAPELRSRTAPHPALPPSSIQETEHWDLESYPILNPKALSCMHFNRGCLPMPNRDIHYP